MKTLDQRHMSERMQTVFRAIKSKGADLSF